MTRLRRTLGLLDGLAVIVGIMVGSGIFRTPGLVAGVLGRPWLTFVAWTLGGVVALLGALVFAELATRHPDAGGKYVYAREAFGPRAAFAVGWIEAFGIYCAAIAAIGVVSGEYLARLAGWAPGRAQVLGMGFVILFTCVNLGSVAASRLTQNFFTAAKIAALAALLGVVARAGTRVAWHTALPNAPAGLAVWGALAVALQSVIWTYYGYIDAAKIAEEVKDPGRTLPRIFLTGTIGVAALYLLMNAAFLRALPFDRIAASTLVAGDVAEAVFGARAGTLMSALALLVVIASLNGNLFVTPRVVFGLARDGLAPHVLSRVNAGGTPWTAMLLVGAVSVALAATGTFERLLTLVIVFILVTDGMMVLVLFRLRARSPEAPFRVPFYPLTPLLFLGTYAALFAGAAVQQPRVTAIALAFLFVAWVVGRVAVRPTET